MDAGCSGGQRGPIGLAFKNADERVGDRVAVERAPARQHLEQHAAERPDVGALVDRLPARLLGAHVGRRAENAALRRAVERARRRLRQVTVQTDAPASSPVRSRAPSRTSPTERPRVRAALQDDVGRLQIAMDDAFLVRRVERFGDLARDRERLGDRQRPAREPIGERRSLDELEDQRVTPSVSSSP